MQTNAKRTVKRPGQTFDDHSRWLRYHEALVQKFFSILDDAAVEYDDDEAVVKDFTAYLKDWKSQRAQGR